jgi:hypothetical protein
MKRVNGYVKRHLGRGSLDCLGSHTRGRAGEGHHGVAFRPVRLAPGRLLSDEGPRGPARRVRGPRDQRGEHRVREVGEIARGRNASLAAQGTLGRESPTAGPGARGHRDLRRLGRPDRPQTHLDHEKGTGETAPTTFSPRSSGRPRQGCVGLPRARDAPLVREQGDSVLPGGEVGPKDADELLERHGREWLRP